MLAVRPEPERTASYPPDGGPLDFAISLPLVSAGRPFGRPAAAAPSTTDAVPSEEDALAYLAEQVDVDSVPHEAPSLPTAGAAAAEHAARWWQQQQQYLV